MNSGEVNLTTLSLTQSFIRKQEKETGEKVSTEQKIQYLQAVKNKSTQEVKQILATISPVSQLPPDKVLYLDKDRAQLQVTVCKSLLEKIEKLKAYISHENIDPSYNEILNLALDAALEKIEKKKGLLGRTQIGAGTNTNVRPCTNAEMNTDTNKNVNENIKTDAEATKARTTKIIHHEDIELNESNGDVENSNANMTSTRSFSIKSSSKGSRYISREVKRTVFKRSHNQCEHIDPDGRRCDSQFQMQFDHIIAFSKNGGSELNNIQHLCRVHNGYKGAK